MFNKKEVLEKFEELIDEGNKIHKGLGLLGRNYENSRGILWCQDVRDFIELYFRNSDYNKDFNKIKSSGTNKEYLMFAKKLNLLKKMQQSYIDGTLKLSYISMLILKTWKKIINLFK